MLMINTIINNIIVIIAAAIAVTVTIPTIIIIPDNRYVCSED